MYKDLYQKILEYYKNKGIEEKEYLLVCKTVLNIYYLYDKFISYEIIWKQAVNKAKFFLAKNKINYDEDLKFII